MNELKIRERTSEELFLRKKGLFEIKKFLTKTIYLFLFGVDYC